MLLTFTDWWNALTLVAKIYWCIAIPFSFLFIIMLIMTFFGGDVDSMDADGDVDVSIETDHGIDFQFLSFKNLVAFFTIFGWTGVASLDNGTTVIKSLIIAMIAGLAMMTIMATIMYYMGKLVESGTLELKNAIGKIGSVYLTIPAKRKGMGQVQIKVQGFRTLDAMTDNEEPITTGSVIEVVDVINNELLLVRPSK